MSREDKVPVAYLVPGLVLAVRLNGEDLLKERVLLWPVTRKGKQESWVLETASQERVEERPRD